MNKNIKERDTLIFGEYNESEYMGGTRRFKNVDAKLLKELIDKDYISLDECQNCSPSTEEFLEFMETYPSFTAHGYVVSGKRPDYRMTIEGIESPKIDDENVLYDFIDFARYADEFECRDEYSCWWD